MKQKQWVLTIAFFAALFMLPVSFVYNACVGLDQGEATYLQEKRELEALPTLADDSSAWPSQIERYMQDHLPFRGTLTFWNANIDYTLFHTTTSDQVTLGKEGWMFFQDTEDITNIADYQGLLTITEEECESIYQTLDAFTAVQAEAGRQTVLFLVPNKEQIYGQYLPDGIAQINEISRTDTLLAYLQAQPTELLIADPKSDLLALAQTDDGLYYQYDSHWTPAGCAVGLQPLLATLGVETPAYDASAYSFTGEYLSGDLGSLAGLFSLEAEEIHRSDSLYRDNTTIDITPHSTDLLVYRSEAADQRRVLVLGDSFRYEMQKQLNDYYAEVGYLDFTLATAELIDLYDPDIIIIEQVERNFKQLNTPIL